MTLLTVGEFEGWITWLVMAGQAALFPQMFSTRCSLVPAFFSKNVSTVSPISMNQSSVKAALFPVMGPF